LDATMSRYLIDQIERDPRITVHVATQVKALSGTKALEGLSIETAEGKRETLPVCGLFSFIGAEPNTDWLGRCLQVDEGGCILTGAEVGSTGGWAPPTPETSRP